MIAQKQDKENNSETMRLLKEKLKRLARARNKRREKTKKNSHAIPAVPAVNKPDENSLTIADVMNSIPKALQIGIGIASDHSNKIQTKLNLTMTKKVKKIKLGE